MSALSEAQGVELGRRLALAREIRGLSLSEAARLCGVAVSSVSRWESGALSPALGSLLHVCRRYGVNPARIVDGLHLLGDG